MISFVFCCPYFLPSIPFSFLTPQFFTIISSFSPPVFSSIPSSFQLYCTSPYRILFLSPSSLHRFIFYSFHHPSILSPVLSFFIPLENHFLLSAHSTPFCPLLTFHVSLHPSITLYFSIYSLPSSLAFQSLLFSFLVCYIFIIFATVCFLSSFFPPSHHLIFSSSSFILPLYTFLFLLST